MSSGLKQWLALGSGSRRKRLRSRETPSRWDPRSTHYHEEECGVRDEHTRRRLRVGTVRDGCPGRCCQRDGPHHHVRRSDALRGNLFGLVCLVVATSLTASRLARVGFVVLLAGPACVSSERSADGGNASGAGGGGGQLGGSGGGANSGGSGGGGIPGNSGTGGGGPSTAGSAGGGAAGNSETGGAGVGGGADASVAPVDAGVDTAGDTAGVDVISGAPDGGAYNRTAWTAQSMPPYAVGANALNMDLKYANAFDGNFNTRWS